MSYVNTTAVPGARIWRCPMTGKPRWSLIWRDTDVTVFEDHGKAQSWPEAVRRARAKVEELGAALEEAQGQ